MKKVLSFILCCFTIGIAHGQQDKQYTHYMFDRMSYNPATTGFKGYCGTLIYRNQWDNVVDAPNTTLLNVQGNMQRLKIGPGVIGLGLSVSNDAIGFQRNNQLIVNGAYHFPTAFGTLSGGVGLGLVNVGYNPAWVPPTNDFDASLPVAGVSGTGFDMNFGLYWTSNDNYYIGISSTHLAPANLQTISYSVARHYYVYGGYNYDLSKLTGGSRIDLKPSVLLKADGSTMVFDVNVMADFWMNQYSFLWAGVTYRYIDAIGIMVGYAFSPSDNVNTNMFKIGYSFDIMTNALNTYGKGTHELMLNYCMFPPAPAIARHGNPFILQ
ncbi:PorP/SprF family type IX secretion system membrane protein [Crocinitomix catalasitica]|uniref:PorP/SprF family type IX secretion system membrane protein n=1 Tax=Crocinitomix catalasitica TaxID=184607 RepID=UPI0009078F7E|nr:PorP/SprF family type IX secretion system membrane protein [Crocinitomix catalasitica]